MARVIVSAWLLLVLLCCLANAQGWKNWFWRGSEETTLSPTKAPEAEDEMSQDLPTPAATTGPNALFESTTDPEPRGKVGTLFNLKQPDVTATLPVPAATSPFQEEGRERNVTGVGEEILSVAKGIQNLVQLLDEKTTNRTERTKVPARAETSTSPAPVTEPGSIQNITANLTGDIQTSLETKKPEGATKLARLWNKDFALLWNKTRVFPKKPGKPRQENFSREVGLLELIGDPPPDQITKIYGPDKSPAYVFSPDANAGQVARYHLPSPFYRDFSLLFYIQATSDNAGVLFALTDASQSIIYVGVKLSEVKDGKQQIIFYYTEPGSQNSNVAATFTVPSLVNLWTRFALSVRDYNVVLYMDCEEFKVVHLERWSAFCC